MDECGRDGPTHSLSTASVLCLPQHEPLVLEILFKETTTLGVRKYVRSPVRNKQSRGGTDDKAKPFVLWLG